MIVVAHWYSNRVLVRPIAFYALISPACVCLYEYEPECCWCDCEWMCVAHHYYVSKIWCCLLEGAQSVLTWSYLLASLYTVRSIRLSFAKCVCALCMFVSIPRFYLYKYRKLAADTFRIPVKSSSHRLWRSLPVRIIDFLIPKTLFTSTIHIYKDTKLAPTSHRRRRRHRSRRCQYSQSMAGCCLFLYIFSIFSHIRVPITGMSIGN